MATWYEINYWSIRSLTQSVPSSHLQRWRVTSKMRVDAMIYNGILCIFICIIQKSWSACPFQNPFSFLDPPSVTTVVDKDGNMAADRVRVAWGKVDNFKCVDFFQIGNMFYNLLGNKKDTLTWETTFLIFSYLWSVIHQTDFYKVSMLMQVFFCQHVFL